MSRRWIKKNLVPDGFADTNKPDNTLPLVFKQYLITGLVYRLCLQIKKAVEPVGLG